MDRLHLFVELFLNQVGDSAFLKNFILIPGFIQNQAQRGTPSPARVEINPDGRGFSPILEIFPEHLRGLCRNLKHPRLLLVKFFSSPKKILNILTDLPAFTQ